MQKDAESVLKRKFSGNRSRFARWLDDFALRLTVFLCAFLFLSQRVAERGVALLLAGILLALAMILFRMFREARFIRFVRRERERTADAMLMERLMLLCEEDFLQLTKPLHRSGSFPIAFQCAEPAGPDLLLFALRCGGMGEKTVFSTGGYSDAARAFAARHLSLRLIMPEAILSCARDAGFLPDESAVNRAILSSAALEQASKKAARSRVFASGSALRYGAAAAILLSASFLTRYALYYRLLAGFCALCAGVSLLAFKRSAAGA